MSGLEADTAVKIQAWILAFRLCGRHFWWLRRHCTSEVVMAPGDQKRATLVPLARFTILNEIVVGLAVGHRLV